MLLSYVDLSNPAGGRRQVEATVTTQHAASSYGRPVVVLATGEVVDALSWAALDYRVERATAAERAALRRALGG